MEGEGRKSLSRVRPHSLWDPESVPQLPGHPSFLMCNLGATEPGVLWRELHADPTGPSGLWQLSSAGISAPSDPSGLSLGTLSWSHGEELLTGWPDPEGEWARPGLLGGSGCTESPGLNGLPESGPALWPRTCPGLLTGAPLPSVRPRLWDQAADLAFTRSLIRSFADVARGPRKAEYSWNLPGAVCPCSLQGGSTKPQGYLRLAWGSVSERTSHE